jgi:putative lipoic acid-binding regulatory protein
MSNKNIKKEVNKLVEQKINEIKRDNQTFHYSVKGSFKNKRITVEASSIDNYNGDI